MTRHISIRVISVSELKQITDMASTEEQKHVFPWRSFVRLPAFWALLINHFCSNMVLYISLAWLPSYFRDAQGLSISGAGLYSAAPWLSMFLMTNVGGWLADRMMAGGVSITNVRKIMQISGLLGGATFLLFLQDAQDSTEALLLMCAVLGMASFTVSGFGANPLDISTPRSGACWYLKYGRNNPRNSGRCPNGLLVGCYRYL